MKLREIFPHCSIDTSTILSGSSNVDGLPIKDGREALAPFLLQDLLGWGPNALLPHKLADLHQMIHRDPKLYHLERWFGHWVAN